MVSKSLKEVVLKPITGEWGNEGNNVQILRTTNFTNEGRVNYLKVVERNVDSNKIEKKKLKIGDIIIEKSGGSPKQPVGRVVFFEKEGVFLCNNFTAILRPKLDEVVPKYLLYILYCNHKFGFTSAYQNKTTGIINLQLPKYLKGTEIPLPPLDQQKKIASVLDAADAYRQKTKALIEKYDELTQSLFLDMFGDDTGTLTELGKVIKTVGGGTPSKDNEQYWNGNIPWASVKDLKSDRLTKTQDFITQSGVDNSATRVVPNGSLIVATRMAVGRAVICEMDVAINQDLKAIQTIGKINITYLLYLFKSKKNYFDSVSSGATVKGIKIEHITKLKVNLPNYSKQNQFADSVQAIETQKAQAQASLAQAEDLFNSLLQRAFKGELV